MNIDEKIENSCEVLRLANKMSHEFYHKPLMICYSGGKDSDVLLNLAKESLGNDFIASNSHTSVDAPETVYHIRDVFKSLEAEGIETEIIIPRYKDGRAKTMWNLIPKKKMPPTRLIRYCCFELKEQSGKKRVVATGVRCDESTQRKRRNVFEVIGYTKKDAKAYDSDHAKEVFTEAMQLKDQPFAEAMDCTLIQSMRKNKKVVVNPIFDWTEEDIWSYIKDRSIAVNQLYSEGFKRVGCVGCPMANRNRCREFERWHKYKELYLSAFERMLEERERAGLETQWKDADEVMEWWLK